jgi:hypothetical protein
MLVKTEEIRELLQSDRRLTVRDIAAKVGLNTFSFHSIVSKQLSMPKVCACWILHILTLEQKLQKVVDAKSFLRQYHIHGKCFMNSIITADETWISVELTT